MPLTFYPHSDDAQKGSLEDRIEILMESADNYKTVVLDLATKSHSEASAAPAAVPGSPAATSKVEQRTAPSDLPIAYNWEEIAILLREIRDLPEATKQDKTRKGTLLSRLAEIYEVLRAAKMSKLEAVRLALINEANQLKTS